MEQEVLETSEDCDDTLGRKYLISDEACLSCELMDDCEIRESDDLIFSLACSVACWYLTGESSTIWCVFWEIWCDGTSEEGSAGAVFGSTELDLDSVLKN